MADHAEVDEDELVGPRRVAVRIPEDVLPRADKEIPGVGIGMEEAFAEDLLEVDVEQSIGSLDGVDPGRVEGLDVGDLVAFDVFEHDQARRTEFAIDRGM